MWIWLVVKTKFVEKLRTWDRQTNKKNYYFSIAFSLYTREVNSYKSALCGRLYISSNTPFISLIIGLFVARTSERREVTNYHCFYSPISLFYIPSVSCSCIFSSSLSVFQQVTNPLPSSYLQLLILSLYPFFSSSYILFLVTFSSFCKLFTHPDMIQNYTSSVSVSYLVLPVFSLSSGRLKCVSPWPSASLK